MKKIKDFVEDNKALAVISLLTVIAFFVGIIICFGTKNKIVKHEKKVLEENAYTMYFKTDSIIKIIFRENFYKCGNKVCSDYTERVTYQEFLNDQAKNTYSNINLKNKNLAEAVGEIITEAKNSNTKLESIQLISNWKSRYSEDEFKTLLSKELKETPDIPIIFEYQEQLNEESIIENATKKSYVITFDSNFGSSVDSQTIFENELAVIPNNPTREGYEFVEWQFNNRQFSFETAITKDYTLKAKWKRQPTVSTNSTTTTTKKTTTAKANQNNNPTNQDPVDQNEKPNDTTNNTPTTPDVTNTEKPNESDNSSSENENNTGEEN